MPNQLPPLSQKEPRRYTLLSTRGSREKVKHYSANLLALIKYHASDLCNQSEFVSQPVKSTRASHALCPQKGKNQK